MPCKDNKNKAYMAGKSTAYNEYRQSKNKDRGNL